MSTFKNRKLWIDSRGMPVITTTSNGARNAEHWGWTPAIATPSEMAGRMTGKVLDPTCGTRMMWFDKQDPRAIFGDQRTETHTLCDGRTLNISPDVELDFRELPFADETFRLVVFDPPHLKNVGKSSWLAAKYGRLLPSWQDDITAGFTECFRVLKPEGILIFKWAEIQIPLTKILACTPENPLFGHTGTSATTHWMTFMKDASPDHHSDKEQDQ